MLPSATGKKTLILGASDNPSRYSYLALRKLTAYQHPVIAIGKKKGIVGDVPIGTEQTPHDDIDTVTLYLNPANQVPYYNYILGLNPKRIIFNPGTENDHLMEAAEEKGIEVIAGCTLVMLSIGNY
ncbi:MAG: CoA-binding protein [Chitinophagaceae bacterium]